MYRCELCNRVSRPGERATIGSLRGVGADSLAARRFLEASRLRVGQRWGPDRWRSGLSAGLRQRLPRAIVVAISVSFAGH